MAVEVAIYGMHYFILLDKFIFNSWLILSYFAVGYMGY